MQQKEHLSTRLEPELLDRLRTVAATKGASVPETISMALDALEREECLTEQLENLGGDVAYLTEKVACIDHKMDQASFNEKERLKSLLQLLEAKIQAHDQAEQARFDRMTAPRSS